MKEIIRQLREEKGYSLAQVAERLGVSRQAYIKYESGEVEPSVEAVRKLSKLYGVSYEDLIDNKVKPFAEYVIPDTSLKISDSGNAACDYEYSPDDVPVYFKKGQIQYFEYGAKVLKIPLNTFLFHAAEKYLADIKKRDTFDDFDPLPASKVLKDWIDKDYREEMFDEWRMSENDLFIFYHVFLEYLHLITDPKRVKIPLTMKQALDRVDYWQSHSRIKVIYPDEKDFSLCDCRLKIYNLGRNRLIDTLVAASYYNNGITEIWTLNPKDFEIFEEFEVKGTV